MSLWPLKQVPRKVQTSLTVVELAEVPQHDVCALKVHDWPELPHENVGPVQAPWPSHSKYTASL